MTKRRGRKRLTEMVGDYEFTVRFAESSTPEATERWERRVEALTALLLAVWKREQEAKSRQHADEPDEPPVTT